MSADVAGGPLELRGEAKVYVCIILLGFVGAMAAVPAAAKPVMNVIRFIVDRNQ